MSAWAKPPTIKTSVESEKIVEIAPAGGGVIPQTISYSITTFKESEIDKKIFEECRRLKDLRYEEDMIVWMRYYDSHLKNMYGILLSGLSKYNIKTRLSFDEFRLYVYKCTVPRLNPRIHKRVRPLI